uniref:cadherin-17 n=1 Tax=Myodes glareolus TaxID=447135 RepID=UPI00201FC747|nr:cadherin-17 [Myodes glareolus]
MMASAWLHCLCLLTLYLAGGRGQEGKFSGPLKPMTFSIFEGQEPGQIIFQFKASSSAVKFELTGETDDIFMIENDGLLYYTKALDRETRAVHHLQLAALDSQGNIVEGPVPITIEVKDINDNRPMFLQSNYEGWVRQNSRPGKPFMYVNATDLDDPNTLNGQLFYQITLQLPLVNNVMYFQINNKTGAISLTQEGSKELDPAKNSFYNLMVSVKDMGGQSENSFSQSTYVNITVRENIWKAPEQVEITENSTEPHPIKITQVQWNDPGAHYSLINKEKLPQFPFSIDKEGNIYVTQPLDREEKDSHVFYATAKDESGKSLAFPVEVHVKVVDINDNPPTCPAMTVFEVQENEIVGSSIGYLRASDRDEANTFNSILKYKLVDQAPKVPSDGLFLIEEYEGKLQLGKRSLKKQDNPLYNLTVEVADRDFQTLCFVQVHVIDINDQIPIFKVSDYGDVTLPEDTAIGSTILVIEATDADEPFTGSSKILYKIIKGDPEGRLEVITDPKTNAGYVTVKQALDFEAQPVANIVFKAENPEPLVSGVSYNDSSYASFTLTVTDVNEAPVFPQRIFQAKVSEDAAIGTRLGNVTARDPEGLAIRYSLSGDKRGWLKIDSVTGEIFSAARLDREAESLYRVRVVATEIGGSALSSVADFHLALTDVNDNPPRLAKEYTGLFFCHPLSAAESLIFEATDDDLQSLWRSQFTFALGRESLKNDWQVSKINGTHARLSTKHTRFEEGVYEIPILLSDEGKPPMKGTVSLSVTFCQCVEGSCFRPAGRHDGIPTVGMAVGILLTTLLVIAAILAVVFYRMKKDEGKGNVENPQSPEAKPLRS